MLLAEQVGEDIVFVHAMPEDVHAVKVAGAANHVAQDGQANDERDQAPVRSGGPRCRGGRPATIPPARASPRRSTAEATSGYTSPTGERHSACWFRPAARSPQPRSTPAGRAWKAGAESAGSSAAPGRRRAANREGVGSPSCPPVGIGERVSRGVGLDRARGSRIGAGIGVALAAGGGRRWPARSASPSHPGQDQVQRPAAAEAEHPPLVQQGSDADQDEESRPAQAADEQPGIHCEPPRGSIPRSAVEQPGADTDNRYRPGAADPLLLKHPQGLQQQHHPDNDQDHGAHWMLVFRGLERAGRA